MNPPRLTLLRARWMAVGAVIAGVPSAYVFSAATDTRDRERVQQIVRAHDAGVQEGLRAGMCLGLRFDTRTGKAVR